MNLRKYQSHKVVEAAKVVLAKQEGHDIRVDLDNDDWVLLPGHRIPDGADPCAGYYVKYEDGYESWSPADAFEAGYTLVPDGPLAHQERVALERVDNSTRLSKLSAFIDGGAIFTTLDSGEQARLRRQRHLMAELDEVLSQRCDNFTK